MKLLLYASGASLLAACSSPVAPPATGASTSTAGASGVTPAPTGASAQPKTGGTLRTGQVGQPLNLDPQYFTPLSGDTTFAVLDRLIDYDDQLQPQPQLAESWDQSSDLKQLKLNLRHGVQWHDGREMTSDDVKYSMLRVRDPKVAAFASLLAAQSGWFSTIDTPDKYTLVLASDMPRPGVFDFLQYLTIVDKNALEAPDAASKLNGTGPFQFIEWAQGDHMTLTRNKNYWDAGRPYLEGITISFFRDPQSQVTSLEAGSIDVAALPQLQDAARMKSDPNYQVLAVSTVGQYFHMTANATMPPTSSKQFRQAIAFAANRQRFTDSILNGLVGAPQALPWAPQSPASEPAKNATYTYDLDKARSLIGQSGVTDMTMDITYATGGLQQEYTLLAQLLQSDLAQLGITATLKQVDPQVFLDVQIKRSYKGIILSAGAYAHLQEASFLFNSSRTFSYNGDFSNSGIWDDRWTQLAQAAPTEPDATQRKALYAQLNDVVLDLCGTMPLSRYPQTAILRGNVHGLTYNQMPRFTFPSAWLG
ncbi:MAG: ABC transporter substrate-binding protein [Chloroflexi bacterium]|nr:ABC transporter substrate-binding protein [Chloroflexota bacterium]